MSVKATTWAWEAAVETPLQRLLLISVANWCGDNGMTDVSVEQLATTACCSTDECLKTIADLNRRRLLHPVFDAAHTSLLVTLTGWTERKVL